MEQYQQKLAAIWKRNNCHPVKSILPILVQAPVFIGFFTSLRSMAEAKVIACSKGLSRFELLCSLVRSVDTIPKIVPVFASRILACMHGLTLKGLDSRQ